MAGRGLLPESQYSSKDISPKTAGNAISVLRLTIRGGVAPTVWERRRVLWDNNGTKIQERDFFDFSRLRRLDAGSIPAAPPFHQCDQMLI